MRAKTPWTTLGAEQCHYALISTFGRVLYNYDEKYLFLPRFAAMARPTLDLAISSVCSLLPRSVGLHRKKGSWKRLSR